MDRLGSLGVFVQVAELRSFTAAGRQLGISPSAVGKAIARLEERLGVRLLHRSTRSIALTPEGTKFLRRCQRIFGEVEAAELEIAQSVAMPKGRLRVSLPFVGRLLTPSLGAFARTYPEVELELDYTDRLVDVIEEGFDVVLRTGNATDSRLMMRTLGTYPYLIVGSPDYLARRGVPTEPEDLLSHACLQHRWSSSGKLERWPLSRDGQALELELPPTAVASVVEPLLDMAEQGVGLACAPLYAVRHRLAAGTLATVLDRFMHDVGTFRILWPSGRHLSPKVKVFVDFMIEHLFAAQAMPSR